ncbi:DUF99 family protein [Halonotius terrestris]|uniref:DUF99 family protein n=1 Tax=Halonotius terrestris TaxID=2487750 RepID=A0A8J8TCW9_9EURY|nr:DUF99 family protein [Halonotius terrestris]TQQ83725.1 DUF99 family protein [Halonotius terrestris]
MAPKPGSRAVGIAASDGPEHSQLCGAVVRADRAVEDFGFARCTTGGTDATAACVDLLARLERPDAQWILLAGVAPAWFNLIDLDELHAAADRPVIAVSFEASDGLADPLREHFSGEALQRRLATYRALPPRESVSVDDAELWVRTVGIDTADAADVLRAFSPDDSDRPEPLRVAQRAARAGRRQAERFGWDTAIESADEPTDN